MMTTTRRVPKPNQTAQRAKIPLPQLIDPHISVSIPTLPFLVCCIRLIARSERGLCETICRGEKVFPHSLCVYSESLTANCCRCLFSTESSTATRVRFPRL